MDHHHLFHFPLSDVVCSSFICLLFDSFYGFKLA